MGYPRMTTAFWEAGLNVNHKKIWRIIQKLPIQSVIRRKRKNSCHLSESPEAQISSHSPPSKKIVTDSTYISDGTTLVYLFVIKACSTTRL
uniref:IS3 family transposase n=1 Tax=Paenibacillus sp. FSL H3-0457 TaxID=2921430 RepID=UPI00403F5D74